MDAVDRRHPRRHRLGTATAVVATLLGMTALAQPGPAAAASRNAPAVTATSAVGHWSWHQRGTGMVLRWRSPSPVPIGDARPEFRSGQRVIGYPRTSRNDRLLSLRLPESAVGGVRNLQVWLGARRLDIVAPAPAPVPATAPAALPATTRPAGDPARRGPFEVESFDYTAPDLPWPAFRSPMEVLGHAVLPVGIRHAPLVLFLHGRHNACYGPGDTGFWPCTGESKPVPSYLGYDYLQRMLASQGYATVSISADAINAQDGGTADGGARARAALVIHHLTLLAGWSGDTADPRWSGRLDMRRVVLVGHSRGGEGVDQAAIETDPSAPYHLLGQVLIAPTDFGWQTAGYLPTEVLLPYCDGDVSDLQGQRYVDAAPLLAPGDPSVRSSVLLMGANHNFFNTEWTPHESVAPSFDDWWVHDDPVCGKRVSPTRLTPDEQRHAAMTYVAAGVHAFLGEGTATALRYLDAPGPVAIPDAGPAVALTDALGGRRETRTLDGGANVTGALAVCAAGQPTTDYGGWQGEPLCGLDGYQRQPHWTPTPMDWASVYAADAGTGLARQGVFRWSAAGAEAGLQLAQPLNLDGSATRLDLRVVADPAFAPAEFQVVLGSAGSQWAGPVRSLAPLGPNNSFTPLWAQTVRVDPADYAGHVDLADIDSVTLRAVSDAGRVWILDVSRLRPGLTRVPAVSLPRVSLGRVVRSEGNGTSPGTAFVPFTVHGEVTSPSRFAVVNDQSTFGDRIPFVYAVVNLVPGQTGGTIAVPYEVDRRDDAPRQVELVHAVPKTGVVTSGYVGAAVIRDDDPAPHVTWRARPRTAEYGDDLRFVLRLSEPVDYYVFNLLRAVRVPGLRPLRTSDVPASWLRAQVGQAPADVPLARVWHWGFVDLPAGATRAVLLVPTLRHPLHAVAKTLTVRLRARYLTPPLEATVRVRPPT